MSQASMSAVTVHQEALESLETVLRRTASKRSTLYDWISKGRFPRPLRIGPRRVAWRTREVDRWIADAIADRDKHIS